MREQARDSELRRRAKRLEELAGLRLYAKAPLAILGRHSHDGHAERACQRLGEKSSTRTDRVGISKA